MIRAAMLGVLLALPAQAQEEVTPFARNVVTHVVAHELAHALIREFDLPLLGNEEVIADDFATLFVARVMPDRAEAVVHDRARSLLVEAGGAEPAMGAEHPPDERRALRAVCLLHGFDPDRYGAPDWAGLSEDDLGGCREAAPEIARGWRRVLEPLLLPEGVRVNEFDLDVEDGPLAASLREGGLAEELGGLVALFDWHSMITLSFERCDGAARWARNGRTIRVCDAHVSRFAEQEARAPG